MLLKCCTQYVSKFRKVSSGHRTAKDQVSFQSQGRAMPKNVQTIVQLHLFHMLVRLCSVSFKLGFSSIWTEKFQMYKLGLEKAEEPEIKLPTFIGLWRKQRSSRKTSTSASLTTLNPLTVGITTNCGKLLKWWEHQTTLPVSWETCMRSRSNSQNPAWTTDWFRIEKEVRQGCLLSACLCYLYTERIRRNARLDELQAGVKTGGKNSNNRRYADDTTLMAESQEELKSFLMRVRRTVKEPA